MSKADQLAHAEAELADLLADYAALNLKINKIREKRDELFKMVNSANFTDIAWLIKNPEAAGAYEATREWLKNTFGGEYRGVSTMGYLHDGKYRDLQLNFQFQFYTYGSATRDEIKANADLFVSDVLPLLKPMVEVTRSRYRDEGSVMMVPLQFLSEESGLDFLGVDAEGTWYHYSQVYGRTEIRRTFANWDNAFEFAWELSQRSEEEDEERW